MGGYGVPRGFKGEKSKFPPNPLGLAERVPSSADDDSPFSKQRRCNRRLQIHPTVANTSHSCNSRIPSTKHRLSEKSALTLHMLHMLHVSCVCRKKKDIRRKSNGFELLPPPAGGPPPSMREVLGEGKSKVCRMSAGARCAPLQRGGKLQLRDAFATLGCIIATVRCICNRRLHRRPP